MRQLWSAKPSGTVRAINSMADYLAREHQVDFYCTKYVLRRPAPGTPLHCGQGLAAYVLERVLFYARKFLTGEARRRPLLLDPGDRQATSEVAAFRRYLQAHAYDAIIFEYLHNHHLAQAVDRARTRVLLDTHDLMHRRTATFAALGRDLPLAISEERELDCFGLYDRVLAIQDEEFHYLQDKLGARALLVKRPAELHEGMAAPAPEAPLRLCFVASAAEHNVDALRWFLESVWSEALARQFRLDVYGAVCREIDGALLDGRPGVHLRFEVADLASAYGPAHLVINPVRIGSGLKIKNIEAMGYGRGVLTTSLGAQGMEECVGSAILTADTAEAMREQLFALAAAPRRVAELSDRALADAAAHFSPAACFGELSNWIASPALR